ncbi:MAG: tetratricopeptide repeat protein [Candidatus Obscuribacterales bacterium]|nr:tetratricopeptide repeat protein [Candidatus Obscuribacterales bacterium]
MKNKNSIRQKLIGFGFALVLVLSPSLAFGQNQNSDLKSGLAFFSQKKYAEAAECFNRAVNGLAKNSALAHYYLAICLSQTGKTSEARAQYKTTLTLNPHPSIATYCYRALGQTLPASSAKAEDSEAESSTTNKTRGGAFADPTDKNLLNVHKRTADTDKVYAIVLNALAAVPPKVKSALREGGCKILIARTIVDACPELATDKPSGYIHGGGYDNCPGMFVPSTKTLYIAERASWNNSPPRLNTQAGFTTLHELGHAYDHVKHDISGGEFKKLYDEDAAHLTNSQRTEWHYYCQEGERGPCELFAELFAICHGTAAGIDRGDGELAQVFPRCYKFIKSMMYY